MVPWRVRPAAGFGARFPECELGDCLPSRALRLARRIYDLDLYLQLEGAPPLAHGSDGRELTVGGSVYARRR